MRPGSAGGPPDFWGGKGRCEFVIPDVRTQRAATDAPVGVTEAVYAELRSLARRCLDKGGGGSRGLLRTTVLVHEAWLRLRGYEPGIWDGRREYAALAASAMRSILVDEARHEGRTKRGSGWRRVSLGEADTENESDAAGVDLLDLEVLLSGLETISVRRARVVELRFFGGLGTAEVAELLGVGERTVEQEWRLARAWLRARLEDGKRGVA